jgi:UrcA family protein
MERFMRKILIAGAAVGAFAAAAPAFAQTTVGELTVTGAWYEDGRPVSLSRPVSYADLDLRSQRDQDILRQRVNATAREICDELGEDRPNHTNLGKSCQVRAINDAMSQVGAAVAYAMNQPPPAYVAPAAPPPESADVAPAPSADGYAANTSAQATYTTRTVTNGPVADTAANRARYGAPMSNAGKRTAPAGN